MSKYTAIGFKSGDIKPLRELSSYDKLILPNANSGQIVYVDSEKGLISGDSFQIFAATSGSNPFTSGNLTPRFVGDRARNTTSGEWWDAISIAGASSSWTLASSSESTTWGNIGGTIGNQADLISALNAKASVTDLSTEVTTRANADIALQTNITAEANTARAAESANANAISDHASSTSNPHSVTKTQVGLGNCDNTSDVNKPVSTAQQEAISAEASARVSGDSLSLKIASNLSDINSASAARINLGLGSSATTDSTAYATAAQGSKADTAVQPGSLGTAAYTAATDYATYAQGSLANNAAQPDGTKTAGQVGVWVGAKSIGGVDSLWFNSTDGYLGIGTNAPRARLHALGSGLTPSDPAGFTPTAAIRTQTIGVQGNGFAYLVAYDSTNAVTFASGVSTNGNGFVGTITDDDFELRRSNAAIVKIVNGYANLPLATASRVLITDGSKNVTTSSVTSTELSYLSGTTSSVQSQINSNTSALMTGWRYFGGVSTLPADPQRAGFTRYGTTLRLGPLFASGACVPVQMGGLTISLTDADAASARVQVALTNSGGTATVRTTSRAWPLNAWKTLHVVVDAPVSGLLAAASLHVYIDGAVATVETLADASGAPLTAEAAWFLGADATGANALSGVISRYGWHVYNYAMTDSQVASWHLTGGVPYPGIGTMQALRNGSFEQWSGTVDDGTSDTFVSWYRDLGTGGIVEAVTGASGGVGLKITQGAAGVANLGQDLSGKNLAGTTVTLTAMTKGDGVRAGRWGLYAVNATGSGGYLIDTSGVGGFAATENATGTWAKVSRSYVIPQNVVGLSLFLFATPGVAGSAASWDDVSMYVAGNMLEGLDLAAQPVCVRTASGSVLYDSASGVAPWPFVLPERMTLATPIALTADGYLIGDRLVHPAGYVVAAVYVTNSGSAAVTATIRAKSSSGTTIATGSIAATGLPVALTISSSTLLTAAGGKIYISGATTSAPLSATIILQRV